MELEVQSLAFGGRGVARAGREVWFVAGALPGERVEVVEERRRRGIVEAKVVRVVTASPWREPSPCPKAGRQCGGCDLAHVASAFREHAAKASLAGALRGAPEELARAVADAPFFPSPWHYRLRGRLHWAPESRTLGFYAPASHRVAALEGCRVLSPDLVELLPVWAEMLAKAGLPAGELEFLEDLPGTTRLLLFRGVFSGTLPGLPGVQGFWGLRGRGWGQKAVSLALPRPLRVPLGCFVQGNRFLLAALWDLVERSVREGGFKRVVDLYGGVGFFAVAAAAGGAEETAVVEISRRAAAAARANVPQAQVWGMPASSAVAAGVLRGAELVILDPPRGGLEPAVREAVAASKVRAVLYVSCDPACLARDSRWLLSAGFTVRWARLFDLFAGTHHVELSLFLERT
ncbi:MAG: class I SAM-dependent RNA methyltransferase [Thermoanaerobaculum sp.]